MMQPQAAQAPQQPNFWAKSPIGGGDQLQGNEPTELTPEEAKKLLQEMDAPAEEITPEQAKKLLQEMNAPDPTSIDQKAAREEGLKKQAKETGAGETILVTAGRRAERLVQGAKQLALKGGEAISLFPEGSAQKYTDETNKKNQFADEAVDALAGENFWSGLAGEALGTAPLMMLGRGPLARMVPATAKGAGLASTLVKGGARGAALGAEAGVAYGALNYDPTNESRPANMITGGLTGGAFGLPLGVAGGAISRIGSRQGRPNLADAEQTAAAVQQAKELGLPNGLTEGLASGNKAALAFESDVLKGAPGKAQQKLQERYDEIGTGLNNAVNDVAEQIPGKSLSPAMAGEGVDSALKKAVTKKLENVSKLYEKIKDTPVYHAPIDLNKAKQVYQAVLENFPNVQLGDKIKNLFDKAKSLGPDQYRNSGLPTFQEAMEAIKSIGKQTASSIDPSVKAAGATISDALYAAFDDLAKTPGTSKRAVSFLNKGRALRAQVGELFQGKETKGPDLVKRIVKGQVDPTTIIDKVVRGDAPTTAIKQIKTALNKGGAAGKEAYTNFRQTTLQKVFSEASDIVNESPVINFKKLEKVIKKIGADGMSELIGDSKANAKFKEVVRVLGRYENGKSFKGKAPSESLLKRWLFNPLLRKIPFVGDTLLAWIENHLSMKQLNQNLKVGSSSRPMVAKDSVVQNAQKSLKDFDTKAKKGLKNLVTSSKNSYNNPDQ